MFKKIGFDVLKLHRVAIGKLRIGSLGRGEMVFLNEVAAERVFMADMPEVLVEKKSYKDRKPSSKQQSKKQVSSKRSNERQPFQAR